MESLFYNSLNFSLVTDLAEFYRSKLAEISRIRSMVDSAKILLHLPSSTIKVYVAEGMRVYKIELYKTTLDKVPFCWIVYMPQQKRLDLYDLEKSSQAPLIQWKNKKPVFKNYTSLFDLLSIDKLFGRIITVS